MKLTNEQKRLLHEWQDAQTRFTDLREGCRAVWARAYLDSDAKTDTARKAAADLATSDFRKKRDVADAYATVCWQTWLVARGRIDDAGRGRRDGDDQ